MGLSNVLSVASTGLRVTQSSLEVVARNIANADTPGYTRKTLGQSDLVADLNSLGVQKLDVTRAVDSFLQTRLWLETSAYANINVKEQFLSRVDELFGVPGEVNALDTIVSRFEHSLQQLTTSPESFSAREAVVGDAVLLAQQLRQLSVHVQDMRQFAEKQLAASIDDVNAALRGLADVNKRIIATGGRAPDLLDERDRLISRLSEHLAVRVIEHADNTVSIATSSGNALLEGAPVELIFDAHGDIGANSLYHADPAMRGVGTIELHGASGYRLDLIQNGILKTGRIGALLELRDQILPQTQAQLDELAHGLALAFANREVAGEAAVDGAQEGFDIDLAGLQSGNTVTLTYTETPPGVQRTVTIVRVDDPSQLPLSNDVTPNPNDTVIGIDFSGGMAAAAAAIEAALSGNVSVSAPGGDVLRFLDDGAAGTIDIQSLAATITATDVQGDGLQLPLFLDGTNAYSASLDGGPQKRGFAGRIAVNALVRENTELLVRHESDTPLGDDARPFDLLARFAERPFTFSPASGIGRSQSPYSGTIADFTQKIVSFQTAQAETAGRVKVAQDIVLTSLKERHHKETGVDIDQELAQLIALQNAYAANARMIQAAGELMRLLLEM